MRVADFHADVSNPENATAEELVMTILSRQPNAKITDTRKQNINWDFIMEIDGVPLTVDAKRDTYIEKSNRFAFEMYSKSKDGETRMSWGSNPRLDFLAIVPASFKSVTLLPLQYIRPYIAMMQKLYTLESLLEHKGWREIQIVNNGYGSGWTTYGYAVPLDGAEKFCEMMGAKIVKVEVPEHMHRIEQQERLI